MLWTGVIEQIYPIIKDIKIFLYYFFAGAIGASLRHLYMFCSHYMKGDLHDYKMWIMYIFYPIFSTGTAVIAVTLIESGIFLVEFAEFESAPYGHISIAFFVGFGFNRFLNKLNEVSKDIFQTNESSNHHK